MLEKHCIARSQVGDLVQTATHKVLCGVRETVMRKIWRLAIDDSLYYRLEGCRNSLIVL